VITNYGTQEIPEKREDEEKDLEAILFGTALHYALENLGSFDEESLKNAMTSVRNRYGQLVGEAGILEIEKRVRDLIENKIFQSLLENAQIMKEQSLSFEGELKQIDLLLSYEDHMLVIDYKSSKKYRLKHQNQVNYYKRAIESITEKPTEGMIVYLLEEGIEIVNLN
jgi:exodeoxyribonuclease V beta subunit